MARKSLVWEAVPDLAEEAARRTFTTVDTWRRSDGLIAEVVQFRRLLLALGMVKALRLFLDHEYVATRVQQLSPEQRLAVLLRYAAGLSPGDAAPVFGLSAEEVYRVGSAGLDALFNLL